jgi:hypothetical protein
VHRPFNIPGCDITNQFGAQGRLDVARDPAAIYGESAGLLGTPTEGGQAGLGVMHVIVAKLRNRDGRSGRVPSLALLACGIAIIGDNLEKPLGFRSSLVNRQPAKLTDGMADLSEGRGASVLNKKSGNAGRLDPDAQAPRIIIPKSGFLFRFRRRRVNLPLG